MRGVSSHRSYVLYERASAMRKAPTPSEAALFEAVRGGRLGVAVRRQVPLLGRYIADLYVPAARLLIEVDGGCHAERRDQYTRRDRALVRAGYRVLRIEAELVAGDVEPAVRAIRAAIGGDRGGE